MDKKKIIPSPYPKKIAHIWHNNQWEHTSFSEIKKDDKVKLTLPYDENEISEVIFIADSEPLQNLDDSSLSIMAIIIENNEGSN